MPSLNPETVWLVGVAFGEEMAETRSFTIDITPPTFNLNGTSTTNATTGETIYIFANFSDSGVGLDTAVLKVNGIVNQTNTNISGSSAFVNFSYITPSSLGNTIANFTITANDTVGNENTTDILPVNITADTIAPSITLNSPIDQLNTSSTTITFNWTATDNIYTSLTCNLTIDGVVNVPEINVTSGTPKTQSVSGFNDGSHPWNVTCIDGEDNVNTSETRTVNIDTIPPTTAPNMTVVDDIDLDGNIELNWSSDPSAQFYNLYRHSSSFTDASVATLILANTTTLSYEDTSTMSLKQNHY